MKVVRSLTDLPHVLLRFLRAVMYGWIVHLAQRIRRHKRDKERRREYRIGRRGGSRARCVSVPERVYRRPDPLIYSQSYLVAQGLAVTWNNPDIQLFRAGSPVDSHNLEPDTSYEVTVRVWNGSAEAPAVGLPVRVSHRGFGIGTPKVIVGEIAIDLPVNGAPGHPATATIPWKTPATPGHYCLQVELLWPDDANPHNNVGQENTDVGSPHSPAEFRFAVHNEADRPRSLRLEVDGYALPELPPCPRRDSGQPSARRGDVDERLERRRRRLAARRRDAAPRHDRAAFPVPSDWEVTVTPAELRLEPGEQRQIVVAAEPPADFRGQQPLNANAYADHTLVGGVTLLVER